ncbi:putative autotransporter adhesin-like protein [Flavobacterium aquaticum]|uniref:Putative autotransporter adhesin-like protein n=2 Tax=Flavobacteriaceae TaxID=49546 RepID=A0A327YWQ4_9FLAO|nr:putative autotransporter adhesin-like protein [Flavobacterium aquaticum]
MEQILCMFVISNHHKMTKKISLLFAFLFLTTVSVAQKKEKIKGSKIVTVSVKEIPAFENIEINDNFEVFLVKADKSSLEIEADDNLHEIINFEVVAGTLRVSSLREASSFKKFALRINYTSDLKLITAKSESSIHALADLELENITIKNYDNSRAFLNVKANYFALVLNDKSEAEINVKAENTSLELSKSAELKALVTSPELKLDMYQKSQATIEGNCNNAKLRLDNSASLTAKKLVIASLDVTSEGYSKCSVNVTSAISLAASGKSEIELLGEPKIQINKFTNNATLYKKEK